MSKEKKKGTTLLDYAKAIEDDEIVRDERTGERFTVASLKGDVEDDLGKALAAIYEKIEAAGDGAFRLRDFLESRGRALDDAYAAIGRKRAASDAPYDVARFHLITMGYDATPAQAAAFAWALA